MLPDRPNSATRPRWHPAHMLALAATLLAAGLRFVDLGRLPPAAWYDEIWFALRARELVNGAPWVAHYGVANTAGNAGLVYLTALVRVLGVSSIVSARPVSALAGMLTVPLAYACFNALFRADFSARRWTLAALAALALGGLAFMIILGRVGMEPALLPPVMLFVVWQVHVALRKGRSQTRPGAEWPHWAAAGLVAGLAQYNGPHARFLLPLIAYLIVEEWIGRSSGAGVEGKISKVKYQILDLAALALPFVMVTVPLIATFAAHPDYFSARALEVAQGISLPANALKVIGAFNLAGDLNPRQNLPGAPMLDVVLSVGFIAGLIWAARHWRRRLARLLPLWLILMTIPVALTAEAPNFGRMIGAAVPAAALAVIGWAGIYRWLAARGAALSKLMPAVAAVLVLASLGWNIYLVVGRWASLPGLRGAFTAESVRIGRDLARRAGTGAAVYVEQRAETLDLLAFNYLLDGTPVQRVDFRRCVPIRSSGAQPVLYLGHPAGKPPAYAGNPGGDQALGLLRSIYAGDLSTQKVDLDWQGRYTLFSIPPGALRPPLPAAQPVARFSPGIDVFMPYHQQVAASRQITVSLAFSVTAVSERDLAYFVHVRPRGVEGQPPLAQADGKPCGELYPTTRWRPGEVVFLAPLRVTLPADLAPGAYEVLFGLYDPASGERITLTGGGPSAADNRAILFGFQLP